MGNVSFTVLLCRMKKFVFMAVILFSCNSNNNQMTKLIKERKILEDNILLSEGNEAIFLDSAKQTHNLSFADSSTKYYGISHKLKTKLEEVNFSIDSLSKMK